MTAADDLGVTPLALACANGSAGMARLLLTAGAEPNRARKSGETPLMTAAFTGNLELVQTLLSHHADVNAFATDARQTALMWATSEKHLTIVKALVAAGADVRARTSGGFSPLLFAARQGDAESGAVLLDAGADPNDRARDGSTALVIAVASGREDMAVLLLERGADPNATGGGYSALHAAVPKDMRRAIKALLAHGADPNIRLKTASPSLFGPGRGAGSEVQPTAGGGRAIQGRSRQPVRRDALLARRQDREPRGRCGCCAKAAPTRRSPTTPRPLRSWSRQV